MTTKYSITMITAIFPNGRTQSFDDGDFELFHNELEHRTENIILNIEEPDKSFVYETDWRGEIINREHINFNIR